jgi:phage tail-like protein
MKGLPQKQERSLMDWMPALYRESMPTATDAGSESTGDLLSRFLKAFDRLLLDNDWTGDDSRAGTAFDEEPLEAKINHLPLYFSAEETPEEFLSWLAGWVALSFRPELNSKRRRKLLASIVPLYRIRGTRRYVEEILRICVDAIPAVIDSSIPAMQISINSRVGVDTFIGGGPPHYFRVRLTAPKLNASEVEVQLRLAASLIELSKPAHTLYELEAITCALQIGVCCTVGMDTILGSDAA